MNKLLYIGALLIILTSCTIERDIGEIDFFTEAINSVEYTSEDNAILYQYLSDFVEDGAVRGVDLNYVYEGAIDLRFTNDMQGTSVGKSFSYDDDGKIIIYVLKTWWDRVAEHHRKILMYHEFGHDILNMRHDDRIIMMKVNERFDYIRDNNLTINDLIDDLFR